MAGSSILRDCTCFTAAETCCYVNFKLEAIDFAVACLLWTSTMIETSHVFFFFLEVVVHFVCCSSFSVGKTVRIKSCLFIIPLVIQNYLFHCVGVGSVGQIHNGFHRCCHEYFGQFHILHTIFPSHVA